MSETAGLSVQVEQYSSQVQQLQRAPPRAEALMAACVLRDEIFRAIAEHPAEAAIEAARLAAADDALRHCAKSLTRAMDDDFCRARDLLTPDRTHWWWYPERHNPLWTIASYFLLTLSLGLMADFIRRLLNSNPDSLGILAIASQAAFTVGASSTFTAAGRSWLKGVLRRLRFPIARQDVLRFRAMVILCAVSFGVWYGLPKGLAVHYNDSAFAVRLTQPAKAVEDYNRALSLYPMLVEAHVNLAGVYLRNYDFSQAAAQYHEALLIDPAHVVASDGLAYALLVDGNAATALRVIDDALPRRALLPTLAERSTIFKNLAWAEYELGFLNEAERDAKRGVREDAGDRALYCVLGKIYTKMDRAVDAEEAWAKMRALPLPPPGSASTPAAEPDCKRLAKESEHATP